MRTILTSALIHAPGLCPDLKWVWLLLKGEGAICRVLRGQARQRLVGGSGGGNHALTGHDRGWVARGVSVGAAVAAHTVLGAGLAVFPL